MNPRRAAVFYASNLTIIGIVKNKIGTKILLEPLGLYMCRTLLLKDTLFLS